MAVWSGWESGFTGMAASSFPSAGWEGDLERKPGPQVAEKAIQGNRRESKQTGLCVAADQLGRPARPAVEGRVGEVAGHCPAARNWECHSVDRIWSPSLAEPQPCHFTPNRSRLVCPPNRVVTKGEPGS